MARSRRARVVNGPLIKPREPGRLTDLARVVIFGALLAVPAFLYASLQAHLHQYRREIVSLEQQLDELDGQRRRLEVELATFTDPLRIRQALARIESELVPINQDQIIYLAQPSTTPGDQGSYVAGTPDNAHGRRRR